MQRADAAQVLRAAELDAVLTAWVIVLLEYQLPVDADIAPWDHWDSYQDLFLGGLVSTDDFNAVDVKARFFSGIRPGQTDIRAVMQNLKIMPQPNMEGPVPKAKPPTEAFSGGAALARPSPAELGAMSPSQRLTPRRSPDELAAFQAPQPALPARPARSLSAFAEPTALPCTEPEGPPGRTLDARMYRSDNLDCQMFCCGRPLKLVDEGGEEFDPSTMIDDDHPMREYMFHATCECGKHFTISVASPIEQDNFR